MLVFRSKLCACLKILLISVQRHVNVTGSRDRDRCDDSLDSKCAPQPGDRSQTEVSEVRLNIAPTEAIGGTGPSGHASSAYIASASNSEDGKA